MQSALKIGAARRALTLDAMASGVMLAPIIVVLAALTLYPFFANVWYSVHARDLTQPFETGFNGVRNYQAVLQGGAFLNSLRITIEFVFIVPRGRTRAWFSGGARIVETGRRLPPLFDDPDPAFWPDAGCAWRSPGGCCSIQRAAPSIC